jgi:hypothetical protein
MDSRKLMSSAAIVFAVGGLACTFAPQELLAALGSAAAAPGVVLCVQALGAAWLGFGLLDWHARGAPFGGIYGRPVALGNFLHLAVIAMALLKAAWATPSMPLVGATLLAAGFAAAFGRTLIGAAGPVSGRT